MNSANVGERLRSVDFVVCVYPLVLVIVNTLL